MSNLFTALGSGALNAISDDALALMFPVAPELNEFEKVVAARFKAIRPTLVTKPTGIYDGLRTDPDNVAYRFASRYGELPAEEVAAGKWDAEIEKVWHERADSEYFYRYEKDWGDYDNDDGWN